MTILAVMDARKLQKSFSLPEANLTPSFQTAVAVLFSRKSVRTEGKNASGPMSLKRTFDLVVAFSLLILTAPLWAFIILGILLSSPGPIFYRGIRTGRDG